MRDLPRNPWREMDAEIYKFLCPDLYIEWRYCIRSGDKQTLIEIEDFWYDWHIPEPADPIAEGYELHPCVYLGTLDGTGHDSWLVVPEYHADWSEMRAIERALYPWRGKYIEKLADIIIRRYPDLSSADILWHFVTANITDRVVAICETIEDLPHASVPNTEGIASTS